MFSTANEMTLYVQESSSEITMHYFTFHEDAQKKKKKSITFLVAVCTNLELQMFNNNKSKTLFLFEFLIPSSNSEVLIPFLLFVSLYF